MKTFTQTAYCLIPVNVLAPEKKRDGRHSNDRPKGDSGFLVCGAAILAGAAVATHWYICRVVLNEPFAQAVSRLLDFAPRQLTNGRLGTATEFGDILLGQAGGANFSK